jgi:hypothetical protein
MDTIHIFGVHEASKNAPYYCVSQIDFEVHKLVDTEE